MADGSSSKVSGAEALGSREGFAKVGNLNVTWIYLDYDNFSETIKAKTNE